jgi:methylmalonyl-CoA mutase
VAASDEAATVMAAPLPRLRLAEPFEALRNRSDQILAATGARPKIFLATLGTPAEFTARANFATNFFEAGGIQALSGTPRDYQAAQAPIACLCASTKTSEAELASAAATLKANGARFIYFAGQPPPLQDTLQDAGVQSFIDEGCDALATLHAAYDILQQKGH